MATRHTRTEVDAYAYIRQQLGAHGWVVKNPSTDPAGQVWTQNQCLRHPIMKQAWRLDRPENVVKLSESHLWVIEAKAARHHIGRAYNEAKDYADRVNALVADTEATIITALAGNDTDGYTVNTYINLNGAWEQVTINDQPTTGLLAPDDARHLLETDTSDVSDFTPPQWRFLQSAERINGVLHGGGINKNDRAKTIAALLLSVVDHPPQS